MDMPIVGRPTYSQLRQLLEQEEKEANRRNRLFVRFGESRAAVVWGLTNNVLEFVLSEWGTLQEALVLDYGCGVVPYKKIFELAGAKILGVDIGENPYAQIRIPEKGMLALENSSFDYVVSFQVLEHVLMPQDYLREAARLLKPSGKLFLTTHGIWPYHPTPGDFHRWTITGLSAEVEQAGFRVDAINYILNDYSALVQSFVMTADYRGVWKSLRGPIHFLTHLFILLLEQIGCHKVEVPAVICITGDKL